MTTPKVVAAYEDSNGTDVRVWEDGSWAYFAPGRREWVAMPRADYAEIFKVPAPVPVADAPEPSRARWMEPEWWECACWDVEVCPFCRTTRPIFAIAERQHPDGTPCQ